MKRIKMFLASACAVAFLATGCGFGEVKITFKATEDGAYHKILTPTKGTEAGKDGIYTELTSCDNDMVRTTISAYYAALKSGDKTKLQEIVSAPVNINDETFKNYKDVVDIKVKHIYTMVGNSDIDFVCFVYYEISFDGIDTTLPSLDQLYISEKDGSYSIINGNIKASVYNEVAEKLADNKGVNELVTSVNILFEEAINKDSKLMDKLGISTVE